MLIQYINLASRPDRRAAMEAQFGRLGLAAERIEARTPADLSAADKQRYCDPHRRRWLTEIELACSFSHIEAFKAIVSSGAPYGLILEDDVVLSARLPRFLADFDTLAPEADVVRLEADLDALRVSPAEPERVGSVALLNVRSWSSGAAGYIMSRRAALRAIETDWILQLQTDRVLFNPYEPLLRGHLVLRHTDPALCMQIDRLQADRPMASDIAVARSHRAEVEKALFPRRMLHDLREIYDRDIRMAAQKAWHQYVGGARKRVIPFAPD